MSIASSTGCTATDTRWGRFSLNESNARLHLVGGRSPAGVPLSLTTIARTATAGQVAARKRPAGLTESSAEPAGGGKKECNVILPDRGTIFQARMFRKTLTILSSIPLLVVGCGTPCLVDLDCNDGIFCNGIESCEDGVCLDGIEPCGTAPGGNMNADCPSCDEATDACVSPCFSNDDCDDDSFCNGQEKCENCLCLAGVPPCEADLTCNEETATCDACQTDTHCDDGLFCNGQEVCDVVSGTCQTGQSPCPEHPYGPQCPTPCFEEIDLCPLFSLCTDDPDCDDGRFCNGVEICNECGACENGVAPDCDDGVPCTEDTCDASMDQCLHTAIICEQDGVFCNGAELCDRFGGGCITPGYACYGIGPCDEENDICIDAFDSKLCLQKCSLPFPTCGSRSFEDYDAFEEALAELEANYQVGCDQRWPAVFVGTCEAASLTVVGTKDGLHTIVDFYDADTGRYVAQRAWSDVGPAICWGKTYWPVAVACDEAVVTEVVCGTYWSKGETVEVRIFP